MGQLGLLVRGTANLLRLSPLARLRMSLWLKEQIHGAISVVRRKRAPARETCPARALVLLYHRISPRAPAWGPTRPLEVPIELFRAQMEELRSRFDVVPLDRLLDPAPASRPLAVVTFDDGYRDNLELAHPILQELGIPAAVFVTTRYLGSRARFWWYELEDLMRRGAFGELPEGTLWAAYEGQAMLWKQISEDAREARLQQLRRAVAPGDEASWAPAILSADDLRTMAQSGLWTIGGHTHSHTILSRLSLAAAEKEIIENKGVLESVLGQPIVWFAYPNGGPEDFTMEHAALLKRAGYRAALSSISPWASAGDDPFSIPRLAVSGIEGIAEFRNHLSGIFWPRR